jgi:hypothetical protein
VLTTAATAPVTSLKIRVVVKTKLHEYSIIFAQILPRGGVSPVKKPAQGVAVQGQ